MPDNGVAYTGVQLQIKGGNGVPSSSALADRELYIDKNTGRLHYGTDNGSSIVNSGPVTVKYNGENVVLLDTTQDASKSNPRFGCLVLTDSKTLETLAGGKITGLTLENTSSQGNHNFKFDSDTDSTVSFMYGINNSKVAQFANVTADKVYEGTGTDTKIRSAIDTTSSTGEKYNCYFGNTYISRLRISSAMCGTVLPSTGVEGQLFFVIQ